MRVCILFAALAAMAPAAEQDATVEYRRRVDTVRSMPGFVALWDFVQTANGRFSAHTGKHERGDFSLDAMNYVREYWGQGRAATYADFPLLGRGPFGQAIQIRAEKDPDFRPVLLVQRERLHGTGLDVKGPGRSVSMVVWMIRESGNHAIAGIWHEGTDLETSGGKPARVERGRRQYALFAGLAAKNGAVAVHVSENGASSFGDKYARNLAVTPELITPGEWTAVGFTFDARAHTATAYWNGKATEHWIDNPEKHPFFQWVWRGWKDGSYRPPERRPLRRERTQHTPEERTEIRTYAFTKVRHRLRRDASGKWRESAAPELIALRVNPFWFPHPLYAPARPEDGGPFTIGRVIHMGRNVGTTGYIGGVAVFGRALTPAQMARLANVGKGGELAAPRAR